MIVVISGTNRPGCNTLKVAQNIEKRYEAIGSDVHLLNLQDLPAELFSPAAYAEKPASFEPFQKAVIEADGVHIVVPEYNGSFPGVLKYFIDMLKFPESFENINVSYTGVAAGVWGGIRAVEQLQMVFGYRNGYSFPHRTFISAIHNKMDKDGNITDDFLNDLLDKQVKGFKEFTNLHQRDKK